MTIARCPSCDGYGWLDAHSDDLYTTSPAQSAVQDCEWCGGMGYVYRTPAGIDSHIPPADWESVAETLEALEAERLREIGFSGDAKKPWEQAIRNQTPPQDNP